MHITAFWAHSDSPCWVHVDSSRAPNAYSNFCLCFYFLLLRPSQVIEREHGIPAARQAFFRVVRRENNTFRPNNAVADEDYGGRCFGPLDLTVQAHIGDKLPKTHPVWGPSIEQKEMIPARQILHTHFYMVELPEQVCMRPREKSLYSLNH
jgi:hypothetical protein